MSRSRDALYRAICAEPDEDTPRLAYADLIEEDGETARAHFIRAQVALARVPEYDPLHVSTRRLDPDVLSGHGMAHTLPKVPGGYAWNPFDSVSRATRGSAATARAVRSSDAASATSSCSRCVAEVSTAALTRSGRAPRCRRGWGGSGRAP